MSDSLPDLRDAPPLGLRGRILHELPLILALFVAALFLLHPAFLRFGYPHGADWDTYLNSTAHLWLDADQYRYNEWRLPLYPWLVGLLGQHASYVGAGQVLALFGTLCTVLGAGLSGRALAGPWVAALAVVSTAWLGVVVDGSWWVNPYPFLAGVTALAVAAGLWSARWGGTVPVALAGLAGGLLLALDLRGLAVAAALPFLAALAPGTLRRRALLVGIVVAGLGLGKAADLGLQAHYGLQLRPMSSQLWMQQTQLVGIGLAVPHDAIPEPEECRRLALGPGDLAHSCAAHRRQVNIRGLLRQQVLPRPVLLVGLLALALLPARWGRRSSVAAAAVLLPSAAAVLLGLSLVPYTDRYLLPVAGLLGLLAPLAFSRVGCLVTRWERLGRSARWGGVVLGAAFVAFVWPGLAPSDLWDPMGHVVRRGAERAERGDPREAYLRWALATLGNDDMLLDCAELRLRPRLLPRSIPLWDAPPHDSWCHRRIEQPPDASGELWLLTLHRRDGQEDPRLPTVDGVATAGWEEVPFELDAEPGSHAAKRAAGIRRWRWPKQR